MIPTFQLLIADRYLLVLSSYVKSYFSWYIGLTRSIDKLDYIEEMVQYAISERSQFKVDIFQWKRKDVSQCVQNICVVFLNCRKITNRKLYLEELLLKRRATNLKLMNILTIIHFY